MTKIASIVAAVAVLLAGAAKFMQGEVPNMTELMLAVGAIAAAVGFQRA